MPSQWVAGASLVVLSLSILGCTTAPVTGRSQFIAVPAALVEQQALSAYPGKLQEDAPGGVDVDAKQTARLKGIVARIVTPAVRYKPEAANWKWEVHLLNTKSMNAWCMAGGKMAMYAGLMDNLKLTDDEIAAIMGHEIAHALLDHQREGMSRQLGVGAGLALVGSAANLSTGQSELLGKAFKLGLELPHDRTQESEADYVGALLAAQAGFNPQGAVSTWQKWVEFDTRNGISGQPEYLSTHPAPDNRIQNLQKAMPELMAFYQANRPAPAPRIHKAKAKRYVAKPRRARK